MADASYGLILAFDSDDAEFCRGVEAGSLWEQLKGEGLVQQVIHATNAEMAIRMCESLEREFSAEVLDETWIELTVY